MTDFVRGIGDGLRGGRFLLARPRLWKYVLAPALVTLALVIVVAIWLSGVIGAPLASLAAVLPGEWAESLMKFVVGIVLVLASFAVFFAIASLIAGPFNEMLSEAIEEELSGQPGESFRLGAFLRDLVVGLGHSLRRVAIYLAVTAGLLVLGVVLPLVGPLVAMVLGALATARFAAYDAYDAVWSRRRLAYAQKKTELARLGWRGTGLGASVALGVIVPGLNLVALSVGAAGATLAQHERGVAPSGGWSGSLPSSPSSRRAATNG